MAEPPTATIDDGDTRPEGRPVAYPAGASGALELTRVGPYRIVDLLGRGGMGAVYLAERDDQQFDHRVAIKVLRPELAGPEVSRRFARERQILAQLDHTNIAKLFDGGMLPDGSPYLIMEVVEGLAIDAFCAQRSLSVHERLALFRQVLSAVGYAHRHLIIHRDIKPSNILVDAEGRAKLLDFGIAKPLEVLPEMAVTVSDQFLMTPAYASPEQVKGETLTTSTDIYSLGVVLYELLTGAAPYHAFDGLMQIVSAIVTEEPTPPSLSSKTRQKSSRPPDPALERLLRGDLDAIVLSTLRKDPRARYPTVEALDADLEAFLLGRPVAARRGGWLYRSRCFVRRHRFGVAAAGLSVVLLTGAAVGLTLQSFRVRAERDRAAIERDRAQLEKRKAQEIAGFLVSLFKISDPSAGRGREVRAEEILDQGAARLDSDLAEQPLVQAAFAQTMGETYHSLGIYDKAITLHRRALELRQTTAGAGRGELAESRSSLAWVLAEADRLDEALALARAAVVDARAVGDLGILAETVNKQGIVEWYSGLNGAAEVSLRESVELRRQLPEGNGLDLARSIHNLAMMIAEVGRHREAIELYHQALEVHRRHYGNQHAVVATNLHNLGTTLGFAEAWAEAKVPFEEALAIRRQVLGSQHPLVGSTLSNLGFVFTHLGQLDAARAAFAEAIAIKEATFGRDNPAVADALIGLALLELEEGNLPAAEATARRSLAILSESLAQDNPSRLESAFVLGKVLVKAERSREAEELLTPILAAYRKLDPPAAAEQAKTELALAEALMQLERPAEARPLLEAALARIAGLDAGMLRTERERALQLLDTLP